MNDLPLSSTVWNEAEWTTLIQDLRMTDQPADDVAHSIDVTELLIPDKAAAYLHTLQDIYESDSLPLIASMFAKRYSYMIVAPSLYAMTMFGKGLRITPDNCRVESIFKGDIWLPHLRVQQKDALLLHDADSTSVTCDITNTYEITNSCSADESQQQHAPEHAQQVPLNEAQRDAYLHTIFADHLQPVWNSLSKAAGVSRAILWENTAIYVYYVYETMLSDPSYDYNRQRIEEDFAYLKGSAAASLFGERWNPVSRFNTPKRPLPGSDTPRRVRQTCCLYYQSADDAAYCSVCPKREA
ncbi:IucA/IucC family C-terminal-domain containing protein [Paenibacillus sp. WLX2291]|uniref:IucA/IucC family C-terminal-domain containing protein n=1 Tax=Paenibacillus sp. WLX2291 TaxID=3296934 RepID=UPI00398401E6